MSTRSNDLGYILTKMLQDSMDRYNLNQTSLAKKLGRNRSMVSRWLNNEQNPHIGTVTELASILNYTVTKNGDEWALDDMDSQKKSQSNLMESNCGEILLNVLREIMNEASEADRAVLGPHFLEISHRLNQRLKHGQ